MQWRPAANISETDKEYLIKAELPEVDKKDVEVTVHDGVITIRGERRFERTDDSEKQHRVESFYGSFARSFSLPADADEIEDLRRVQGRRAEGAHPEDRGAEAEGPSRSRSSNPLSRCETKGQAFGPALFGNSGAVTRMGAARFAA